MSEPRISDALPEPLEHYIQHGGPVLKLIAEYARDARARCDELAAELERVRVDLDAAAEALIELRLIAGAAGQIDKADAHLTSLGFAYPFTGYRAQEQP